MQSEELKAWRKQERQRLIAARLAVDAGTRNRWRGHIDLTLERHFPALNEETLAFCWPIQGEYDARFLARQLRERGCITALPVVVGPGKPLIFREWHAGIPLVEGALGIPYPPESLEVTPSAVLLPMNGWDARGYRLGYGAGFFDRTLAAFTRRPVVIGVTFELARIDTIYPQDWDIPVDFVVTEKGLYRPGPDGLLQFQGA